MHDPRHEAIERGPIIVTGWPELPTSRPRPHDQACQRRAVMRLVAIWIDVTGALTADYRKYVDVVKSPPVSVLAMFDQYLF